MKIGKNGLASRLRRRESRRSGFTLVEMLVVIAVLSVSGVLILNIFTRTLRGSNKSQLLGVIKQNGQSVLDSVDKTIRNSDNVVCVTTPPSTLIVVKNGVFSRYRFISPTPQANGFIKQDNPAKQINPATSKEETDAEFGNRVCAVADPMINAAVLTDTALQTGVSVENASFTRDKTAGFRDQITIKFDIRAGIGAAQGVAGTIDPVRFQTTIQLR